MLTSLFALNNALPPEQLVLLLRNLLQLPKELVQLMALLADLDPAMGQELLKTLLQENPPIPMEALQQWVQTQAGQAQDKLLKLLQSGPMSMGESGKQLGELMSHLSDMVSKTGKSPMEAFHTAISLYLPAYPLHPPQAFRMRFEASGGGDDEEEASGANTQAHLVLWIETIRLGVFKIILESGAQAATTQSGPQSPGSRYCVWVEHDPFAEPALESLKTQMLEASGGSQAVSIQTASRTIRPRAHAAAASTSVAPASAASASRGQSVEIQPAGGMCAGLMCLAYLLIRLVFELDNREELYQQRAAAIE